MIDNRTAPYAALALRVSLGMMFRYSFDHGSSAHLLDKAAKTVVAAGYRTGDIMAEGARKVGTVEMGDAILTEFEKLSA